MIGGDSHSAARLALCGCAALLLAVTSAGATSVVAKSFTDLCREADLIFVGGVVEVKSQWADPQRSRIETAVTFSDLRWVRGGDGSEVTLHFAGGEVDGITEVIGGMPHFHVGQRVLLFARNDHSISPIVGFHQGCLGVVPDAAGGEVVVAADGRPVVAVNDSGFELAEAGAPLSRAVSLQTVLAAVENCLRSAERGE
jgi:hypothetical protein